MPPTHNTIIIESLNSIGLNSFESELYLTGLRLGPSTILQLSKKTNIKRTTIYGIISGMIDKGIFELQIEGWKQKYVASSPQNLKSLIHQNYEKLLNTIPALEKIQLKEPEEIYIKSHSGTKNIQLLYQNILSSLQPNSEYLIIGNTHIFEDTMADFSQKFFAQRAKLCKAKNITIKALFVPNLSSKEEHSQADNFGVNIRYLPSETILETNYVITDTATIFHQTKDNRFAFETNSPEIIKTQRELFKILWESAS
jgi:sugar-specific transcriptional regulator TrmB